MEIAYPEPPCPVCSSRTFDFNGQYFKCPVCSYLVPKNPTRAAVGA